MEADKWVSNPNALFYKQIMVINKNAKKQFVCINCGHSLHELCKKYSNIVKAAHCAKCHKISDKYIEFESIITLVDALLLSQNAFRHMIYNAEFKLYWKLSLVLLLLESFALRRKKCSGDIRAQQDEMVQEKGFYICSLQNLADYIIITGMLLIILIVLNVSNVRMTVLILLKAIAISNLSKIFILPILVWRANTTDLGRSIHYYLVLGHHLCSLILVVDVVINSNAAASGDKRWLATLVVLPTYFFKECIKYYVLIYIEKNV